MKHLSQQEIYEAFDRALKKVAEEYEAGTLDMSGRYYTDEELAQMRELGTYYISKKAGTAA